jgi:hypothetical protein
LTYEVKTWFQSLPFQIQFAALRIGVICYLKQLLDTGFFHADPHPGGGLYEAFNPPDP